MPDADPLRQSIRRAKRDLASECVEMLLLPFIVINSPEKNNEIRQDFGILIHCVESDRRTIKQTRAILARWYAVQATIDEAKEQMKAANNSPESKKLMLQDAHIITLADGIKIYVQREGNFARIVMTRPAEEDNATEVKILDQRFTAAQTRDFAGALTHLANAIGGEASIEIETTTPPEKIAAAAKAYLHKWFDTEAVALGTFDPWDNSATVMDCMRRLAKRGEPTTTRSEYLNHDYIADLRAYGLKTSEAEACRLLFLCIHSATEEMNSLISFDEMASILISMTPEANDHMPDEDLLEDFTVAQEQRAAPEFFAQFTQNATRARAMEEELYAKILNPPEDDPAEDEENDPFWQNS